MERLARPRCPARPPASQLVPSGELLLEWVVARAAAVRINDKGCSSERSIRRYTLGSRPLGERLASW